MEIWFGNRDFISLKQNQTKPNKIKNFWTSAKLCKAFLSPSTIWLQACFPDILFAPPIKTSYFEFLKIKSVKRIFPELLVMRYYILSGHVFLWVWSKTGIMPSEERQIFIMVYSLSEYTVYHFVQGILTLLKLYLSISTPDMLYWLWVPWGKDSVRGIMNIK